MIREDSLISSTIISAIKLYNATTSACAMIPPSTRNAPTYINVMIATLIKIYVSGFINADKLPTCSLYCVKVSFSWLNCCTSVSSLRNARITLTPNKFSRNVPNSLSNALCTFV